ncbi:unnamed protein product [Cylicocyclus nassatus]|uniref:t-SNARE coiled-coil homology domain-containing protein n=1 Tax=Cylicocyclus nassatus TaxID=53992 RepID=A0AA36M6U9_CYLNA|nr:unnamed protein product [Cylicocyclus nassatus]
MPIKDRLASLKRFISKDEPDLENGVITVPTEEEETTDYFLQRVHSVREAITEMDSVVELIRQMHSLLRVSNSTPDVDRERLRLLFEKLSEVIEEFSHDLDKAVAAVNDFHDEVKLSTDKRCAHYRMRKNQTESLKKSLHSVILKFRKEEVPFLQESKPTAEQHLREFNMKPVVGAGLARIEVPDQETVADNVEHCTRLLSPGLEINDVEKGNEAEKEEEEVATPSLKVEEIDEENANNEQKAALEEIKQRNEDLHILEEAVAKVNALHEHLNFIVHTQNAYTDRIDKNISDATEYTAMTAKNLDEALRLRSEEREKRILVFIFIAVATFILFLIIVTYIKISVAAVP